ncbi:uncharacterized protein LOC126266587 [Aethina tumida]|uniref:uncharacterized protein LOC126266587 n=1 Tax=Aethina tumida TaxID=116153 RepID=UPI00214739A3|nr:uncharacterized protein LOC126266587 [Aethina tumida]
MKLYRSIVPYCKDSTYLDTCVNGSYIYKLMYLRRFPQVSNCKLRVSFVNYGPYFINLPNNTVSNQYSDKGIEYNVLNLIAEKLNFTITYITSSIKYDFGDVYPNGTTFGQMRWLKDGQVEMAVSSYMVTLNRFRYFEASQPFMYTAVSWCLPHELVSKQKLQFFNCIVWICILCTMSTLSLAVWYLHNRDNKGASFFSIIYEMFAVIMTMPIKVPRMFGVRYMLTILFFFAFYFNVVFRTSLISNLSTNFMEEKYTSIESIEGNLQPSTLATLKTYFIDNKLFSYLQDCNDTQECLYNTAHHKTYALAIPTHHIQFLIQNSKDPQIKIGIHCLGTPVVSNPLTIYFNKGFPFANRLSQIVQLIVQHGFVEKWHSDYLKKITTEQAFSTVNLNQFKPVVNLYVIGVICSIVGFLLEVLLHRMNINFIHY